MLLCSASIPEEIQLLPAQEIILTWTTDTDMSTHHTKKEYFKIFSDASYQVGYEIKWKHVGSTTQPLHVTIYKVHKDYGIEPLHQHVTVCVGNPITLRKKLPFDLKTGERVCIGVKNLSTCNFILLNCQFSLSQ